jgi:hypothetical protein
MREEVKFQSGIFCVLINGFSERAFAGPSENAQTINNTNQCQWL